MSRSRGPTIPRRGLPLAAALLVVALTFAACASSDGGAPDLDAPGVVGTPTQTPGSSPTGASPSPEPSTPASVGKGSKGSPESSPSGPPSFAPGTTPAPVDAGLDAECVEPGGSQGITIHTRPRYELIYNTTYADGRSGGEYGGTGTGQTSASGDHRGTWVVLPNAPIGTARVDIAVAGGNESAFRQLSFRVARSCQG
jgi:hypothetical protein